MHACDYRSQARWALKGKWKNMIGIMLLAQAILSGLGLASIVQNFFSNQYILDGAAAGFEGYQLAYSIPTATGWVLFAIGQLIALLGNVVYIGLYRVCMEPLKGGSGNWRQLFPMDIFWKALLMNLVRGILVFLQALLLVVPGLIAIYRYSMADYMLAENPELGPVEALRCSSRHMRGHKMRLFGLHFSFLGWALLASMAPLAVLMLFAGMPVGVLVLIEIAANWFCNSVVSLYMHMAETAFFVDLLHGSVKRDWREAAEANREDQPEEDEAPETEERAVPHADPVRESANAAKAQDLFLLHRCSLNRLRGAGLMEEYEKLNPSRFGEERWKRDYAQALMRRFDYDPGALDDLLEFAAEYALDDLADRMLMRIDRHIRRESLNGEEIINMLGRVLAMLLSGAFASNEGFVGRKKADISAMLDRLEAQLSAENPEGEWKRSLELIRQMCA